MKIVCISDSHCQLKDIVIPEGDILIHAGDLSFNGTAIELSPELEILGNLPHKYKIVIAGNHDFLFERDPNIGKGLAEKYGLIYLENSEVIINDLKIYGSPVTPFFYDWAFNVHRGEKIERVWSKIPDDTNILITHGPPMYCKKLGTTIDGRDVGCEDLHNRLMKLYDLKLHVFGHIHHGRNYYESLSGVTYVNASVCNEKYKPVNAPYVFDINDSGKISYLSG